MPTNFGTGFGPSFGPSFGFSGWNQTWGAGQQQKTPTKQQKFPGLSEEQIKRLESITSDPQQQQKLYKQAIQKLNDQNYKDNRVAAENEMDYRSLNQNDPRQANNMQSRVRLEKLADVTKDKYGLNQDANTKDVIKGLISMAEDKGVDIDLLNKYLQSGDENFLYELGLKENPREKLKDNFWDSLWNNIKTKANIPVDTVKKWGKRTLNEGSEKIYKSLVKKVLGDSAISDMGINLDDYVDTITDNTLSPALKEDSLNYQNEINERYRALSEKNLDQDIENYYNSKGYTEALKEGDFLGFLYKSMGDAAQNREMPAVVAVSIFQPEVGLALMTSDAYARENQEAFENMMENGASYEQAEKGGVVVGLINAMIELFLEKAVGGVETSASRAIRKTMLKNVQEEATKKGLGRIVLEGLGTQLRASGEEGLEEWVQQIVQNAAVKTVNENQKLFEGTREAFEGGFFNLMNLLAGGGNLNQNLQANKSQIRQQVMDGAYTAGVQSRELLDAISNKTQNAGDKVSGVTNQLYGLDELTKKDIQNNPYSAEVWQRTKNYIQENGRPERSNEVSKALITDVADRVQEKLMAKMKEGGESGRMYKPLLEAGYSVDLSELKSGIDDMLRDYGIKIEDGNLDFSKTAIDGSEASNIKKIYNWIQDTNAPMSLEEYKNRFRQTINDMVDFNQNGRDLAGRKTADTQGDKVLKGIRAAANDLAHNQIPALASLDKTFNERVKTMDEVSDGLVYKDKAKRGVIRDNITQIIKNLDTPNRRELANRLEKLMPGIKEEVRAINMMPKLVDHVYKPSRLQQTITSSAGGIIGTSIGGPVGGIIGAGGGYLLSKWIDKLKSSKWDKVISQTSAEGKAKLTDIQNRIENNEKISQAQKAFLEKIGEELKQGKEKKQGEIAQIIADISSAEDGDVVSVLNNAIDRLETIGAKTEAKEVREWMEGVQKELDRK